MDFLWVDGKRGNFYSFRISFRSGINHLEKNNAEKFVTYYSEKFLWLWGFYNKWVFDMIVFFGIVRIELIPKDIIIVLKRLNGMYS